MTNENKQGKEGLTNKDEPIIKEVLVKENETLIDGDVAANKTGYQEDIYFNFYYDIIIRQTIKQNVR